MLHVNSIESKLLPKVPGFGIAEELIAKIRSGRHKKEVLDALLQGYIMSDFYSCRHCYIINEKRFNSMDFTRTKSSLFPGNEEKIFDKENRILLHVASEINTIIFNKIDAIDINIREY
jgi:hypothetical protein